MTVKEVGMSTKIQTTESSISEMQALLLNGMWDINSLAKNKPVSRAL